MRAMEDEDVNINSPPCASIMGRGTPPPPPPQPRPLKSSPPLGKNPSSITCGNSGSSGGSSGMGGVGSGLKTSWGGSSSAALVPVSGAEGHCRQVRIRERSGRLKRDDSDMAVEDASDEE